MLLIPVLLLGLCSCANQTTPTGGPKDEIPPRLLATGPTHGSTNFRGREVTLLFDEAVKVENAKEQLMISPSVGKDFTLIARKNQALLTFDQPLADSTTYSIRFRESIKDITEGNPADNIELAFSTGPYLDSLSLTGTVKDLLTGRKLKDVTVAVFLQDTFDVFRHSPTWFSKSDAGGAFALRNLKPGRYHVYAFDDKNKNLRIDSRGEKYGLHPEILTLRDSVGPVQLPLLALDARPLRLIANRPDEQSATLTFNKPVYHASLRDNSGNVVPLQFEDSYTRIRAYAPGLFPDSLRVSLRATDSVAYAVDTLIYIKARPQRVLRELFKPTIAEAKLLAETGRLTAKIQLNKPLLRIHFDSIFYELDSAHRISLTLSDIRYDTLALQLLLNVQLEKSSLSLLSPATKSKRSLASLLYLGQGALHSVTGDSSVRTHQKIVPTPAQDLGTLLISVQTDRPSFEVQLIHSRTGQRVQSLRNQKSITFRNVEPGEYMIRVLVDQDSDGRWEWGNPLRPEAPEPVAHYLAPDGKETVTLRANWELGPLLLKF
jgi:uncharacterized protein (DUF2141 family)